MNALEYLNISRCAMDETSLSEIFGPDAMLKELEVLGMAHMVKCGDAQDIVKFKHKNAY